ncbi:MAG: hypothetical protein V4629_03285 [Pseudomonadota bacterium]
MINEHNEQPLEEVAELEQRLHAVEINMVDFSNVLNAIGNLNNHAKYFIQPNLNQLNRDREQIQKRLGQIKPTEGEADNGQRTEH